MSVFVTGMEMPKSCKGCDFRDLCFDYYRCLAKRQPDGRFIDVDNVKEGRHPDCPLVEIPTPHGRLIDADFLVHKLNLALLPIRCSAGVDIDSMNENQKILVRSVIRQLESAPTIIEAEVSENGSI